MQAKYDLPNLIQFAGGFVQSENKCIRPHVQPVDRRLFETWDRDKLTRVHVLVHSAVGLIEVSGQAPRAAAKARALLADIDAMLAEGVLTYD